MVSPFHSIIDYNEDNWQEFLEKILLIDVFMPVIKAYPDIATLKCVIRYIVYAYSVQSDKVILGMDWQQNKQQIFEFILAKPEATIYEDLVLLRSEPVLLSIHNWLEYQDNDTFKQLSALKDLRVEMQISSVNIIRKSSGEIDYDQKFKNAGYAQDLKKMISDLESELIQNDSKLKEAIKEVRQEVKPEKNSRSVGSYAV